MRLNTTKLNYRIIFWILLLALPLMAIARVAISGSTRVEGPVISEVMAANRTILTDDDGDAVDWLEIFNPGSSPLNLSGYALTDDPTQPEKWRFPNLTLGSQEYLLVYASGKNRTAGGQLHTNFKLDAAGEFLALHSILGNTTDSVPASPQFSDVAYGQPAGQLSYGYLTEPTPGRPNPDTLRWAGVIPPVQFSAPRGFYDNPFQLELSVAAPDVEIRYTLDGSAPAQDYGQVYTQPLDIAGTTLVRAVAFKSNYRPSDAATHSYIFLNDVLAQSAAPSGYPATWGNYRKDYKFAVGGAPAPADYQMDPKIVNDPRYRDTIKADLQSIPSLSIVINPQHFDIYTHPRERGRDWERPASIELFDPHRPGWGFQLNSGLRLQGDIGREEFIPKHSFRLFFRDEYGAGRLEFPLFANSPVDEFDTLTLRGGVQSSWVSVWTTRRRPATYTRDEWLRQSQIEMSGMGAHGTFVHLYLNGMYWGLYNIVERPDRDFAASYLNIDKDDWYAVNHTGAIDDDLDVLKQKLAGFIKGNTQEQRYASLADALDLPAFADYVILNWYAGTGDWPNNNWYAGFERPNGKIRFFVWDGELTWHGGAKVRFGIANAPGQLWPNVVQPIFEVLIQNPEFKILLADRIYKHLFNDGALSTANSLARWQRLNNSIDRAIVGESARWGDTREPEQPLDRDDWLAAVAEVAQQMRGNDQLLLDLTRQAGYYPAIDPPQFNRRDWLVDEGFELTLSAPDGDIYYTLQGTDPRLPGNNVAPEAIAYRQPIPINQPVHIMARVLRHGEWSALAEATFNPVNRSRRLQITEIMYNADGQSELEFLELQNSGSDAVDVSGMTFEGIEYTFPPNTVLAPGQVVLLARNADALATAYPLVRIDGLYLGQLANQGETVALKAVTGQPVVSVTYDDDNGWPVSADGYGDSLVPVSRQGDPNDSKSWRAGPPSPGQVDF